MIQRKSTIRIHLAAAAVIVWAGVAPAADYRFEVGTIEALPVVFNPAEISETTAVEPVAERAKPWPFPGPLPQAANEVSQYQPGNPSHLHDLTTSPGDKAPNELAPCRSFTGTTYTGWDPPDPQIAAGPNHIVEVVNSTISVFDKNSGNLLYQATAQQWFAGTQPAPPSAFIYDPKVIYDPVAARFVILFLCTNSVDRSAFLVSASQTSSAMGSWWNYCLDAAANGSTPEAIWPDYPGLACDFDEAVYISANMWGFDGYFEYAKVRIVPKSRLYGGQSLTYSDLWDMRYHDGETAFAVKPALMYSDANGMFLLSNLWHGGNSTAYWKITNPLGMVQLTLRSRVGIAAYTFPPSAPQRDGSNIGMLGPTTQNVIFRNGRLYTAFDQGFNWGSGVVAAIRVLGIDTANSQASIDVVLGADRKSYFLPSIHVDPQNHIYLSFNRSATDEYVSVRYVEDLLSDQRSRVLKTGDGARGGSAPVRWGDHSCMCGDPLAPTNVWLCGEYNTASPFHWGTWVGQIPSKADSPFLVSPIAGAQQINPVLLYWDPNLPAGGYVLQLDDDSTFSSPVVSADVDTNRYQIGGLTTGRTYYWRVRGVTVCPDNPWSNIGMFKACAILPGDADHSGYVTISDAVYLISYIFSGGPAPTPSAAGDADCDAFVNISDAVRLIGYIFSGGAQPCGPC